MVRLLSLQPKLPVADILPAPTYADVSAGSGVAPWRNFCISAAIPTCGLIRWRGSNGAAQLSTRIVQPDGEN